MFDGSSLALEENLRISLELLAECARAGLVLEVECGVVRWGRRRRERRGTGRDRLYTTSEDLLRVAEVLGTGERGRYLLAATFGNVHGLYAAGDVELRPEILRDGQDALAAAHPGARFQYVFHGSSGSSEKELRDAIRYGVVKSTSTRTCGSSSPGQSPTMCAHTAYARRSTSTRARGDAPRKPSWRMR
jgi:fructose-bisphosphate aldolase, class II